MSGAEVFPSLTAALQSCKEDEHVYIIGGASIYQQALPFADELCLTEIDSTAPEADVYFPEVSPPCGKKKAERLTLRTRNISARMLLSITQGNN